MHLAWLKSVTAGARPEELLLLGHTRGELASVLADERAPRRKIARAILGDPALALRVLQRANAVEHRHFKFELPALENAAHMLGTATLSRMAEESELARDRLPADRLTVYLRASGRAVLAALLAIDWAELEHDGLPAEIGLAALLNNLGELFLLARGDARMGRYLEMVERFHAYPHEAEYVTLGVSLEDLGHSLAVLWGLPEMVRESMRARNAQHLRTLCVMLATQTARYALTGWCHPLQQADLALTARVLDLSLPALRERINAVLADFNTQADRYALAPLPLLPASMRSAEPTAQDLYQLAPFCLAPRADDYVRALRAIEAGDIPNREILFRTLIAGLHRGLGLNRVVVALYDPKTGALRAEYLAGTDFEPGFNRFSLAVDQGGVFAGLVQGPAELWLNPGNRAELEGRIPPSIRELTGVDSFYVASLPAGGSHCGLIYADRRNAACALDAASYRRFLTLVKRARGELERLPA